MDLTNPEMWRERRAGDMATVTVWVEQKRSGAWALAVVSTDGCGRKRRHRKTIVWKVLPEAMKPSQFSMLFASGFIFTRLLSYTSEPFVGSLEVLTFSRCPHHSCAQALWAVTW